MERGLVLYRSSRVEALAERLVDSLRASRPADPIAYQEVVVGSRGMARWLRHRIATLSTDELCCNIDFPFPETAIQRRLDDSLSVSPEFDTWKPDVLAWTVLREFSTLDDPTRDAAIADWLAADSPADGEPATSVGRQTWALARDVADVIDRLIRFRPDWLHDEAGLAARPIAPWLLELWRRIGRSQLAPHHAARLAALDALPPAATPRPPLHVFGFSAFPPATLQALQLLARHGPVEIFAFVPSEAWWSDFHSRGRLRQLTANYRSEDRDALAVQLRDEFDRQHPLLTGLGRLSRDFQALVENEFESYHEPEWDDGTRGATPSSLLEHLQHSIRQAAWPPEPAADTFDADDSIQIHACHGARRQVEVLRETLLDLLEQDETIQPRDILVMTPDLATYAPLMASVFDQGSRLPTADTAADPEVWGPTGAPRLPVQVSDLGIRQLNSVADAVLRVLEFAEGRMTASKLSDMLTLFPVRERFGIGAEDVDAIRHWIAASGLRWGIDASDRKRAGHPDDPANTMQFALERLALGVVRADDAGCWQEGIAPIDELEGTPVPLLGRALQFLRTVAYWCEALRPAAAPAEWAGRLQDAVESLTATDAEMSFLSAQVQDALEQFASEAAAGGFDGRLRLSAVRHWLEGRLENPAGGDRPITGAVTVSAMQPMRSVPFRVIALIGLDDGIFPRTPAVHGFDPTHRPPRMGDRSPRDEDRHLFLEAILSARRHLILTYTGRDDRTNEALPPSGVVHELRDVLERGWPSLSAARHTLHRDHPLQPFSATLFAATGSDRERPYGTGNRALAEHIADGAGAPDAGLFSGGATLPAVRPEAAAPPQAAVTLEELESTLRQPNRHFLRARLGLRLGDWSDRLVDREPVAPGGLEQWQLRGALLEASITESGPQAMGVALARLRAEGRIPLGNAGSAWIESRWDESQLVVQSAADHLAARRETVEIDLDLGDLQLVGQVDRYLPDEAVVFDCVHDDPEGKPRHRIALWVRTLAVAAQTGRPCRGVAHGFRDKRSRTLEIVSPDDPHAQLADLLRIWRDGMAGPLRLAEKTSFAFAKKVSLEGWQQHAQGKPLDFDAALHAADEKWEPGFESRGEGAEPELRTAFGQHPIHRTDDGTVHPEFLELAGALWWPQLKAEKS